MAFLNSTNGGYIVGTAGLITVAAILYIAYDKSSTIKEATKYPTAAWNAFTANTRAPSPLRQGSSSVSDAVSDLVSETESILGSNSSSRGGGSRRKCKKGGKRKTKGQRKR